MASSWKEALAPLTQSYSINAAIQAFGGDKAAFTAAYAGTSDKKSKAYQTAQTNIRRWGHAQQPIYGPLRPGEKPREARHISKAGQGKLNQAVRAHIKQENPLPHINLRGTIGINGFGGDYEREREIDKDMSWDALDELAEAYGKGGEEAANDAFAEWYGSGSIQSFYMEEGTYTIDY